VIAARLLVGLAGLLSAHEVSPATNGLRLEHFVLERTAPDGNGARLEVGLVCLRRREVEGGRQLESECLFFRRGGDTGEDEHVLEVERDAGPGPALVWREWGGTRSRCLTAERSADGSGLLLVETSRGGVPRATIEAPPGVLYPLELIELARAEAIQPGRRLRFDPLSRSLETIEVKTARDGESSVGGIRTVDFLREDGSSAGRFEFRGSELLEFQWQEGDLHARRVEAELYAQRLGASQPAAKTPSAPAK
jgi:hypothetical protein